MSNFKREWIKRRGKFLGFDKDDKPVHELVDINIYTTEGQQRGAVEIDGRPSKYIMFDWSGK